jgi:hypothetical protein
VKNYWIAVILCMASLVCAAPLKRGTKQAPAYTQPAENLLIVVADIQRHIRDDVYRFPYPSDVTGQNVFRAGLVRLVNYETLYPGRVSDAVALSKAQALEKLCAYREAGRNYENAGKSNDEAIRKVAGEGLERCRRFAAVVYQDLDMSGLRPYERDLQKKIRDLDDLATQYKGSPHQFLALVERERAQTQLAEFYVTMRFMRPYSPNDAITQIKRNIDQNKESKRFYFHHLMLADLYYDLAKEYTMLHDPEGADFEIKEFERFTNSARSEYHIIQQADGFPEKLEARAKLLALEAFVERVTDWAK